jgi:transcriptional regulator with XRE-family HTH domain
MPDDLLWRRRLTALRKKRGFSKKALAELTGLSQAVLTQYENGSRDFTQKTLGLILDALQVSWADLFCGCSGQKRSSDAKDFNPLSLRQSNLVHFKKKQSTKPN